MNLKSKIRNSKRIVSLVEKLKRVSFPGFAGIAIYDVGKLFIDAIIEGVLPQRAAAISYNFLMALFPTLLIIFALIPIIPIDGFQVELLEFIVDFMPADTDASVIGILNEIITKPQNGVLSASLILSVWFATNGFNSIIVAFNSSVHITESRSYLNVQKTAFVLFIVFFFANIFTISGFVFDKFIINSLVELGYLVQDSSYYVLITVDWIIRISMLFFQIAFIYWYAPAYEKRFRIFSLGATFTTVVFIIVAFLFNLYISNFSKYNVLYGSIATLLIVMVWLYISAFILLIGFEINTSIVQAKQDILDRHEAERRALLNEKLHPFKEYFHNLKDLLHGKEERDIEGKENQDLKNKHESP
ncbi:MAG: YihY/virulence factor BrkB family protein [Bacteroidales bacterium]|nr:YihY/virulence factor BrkB family protein [Bacteroidales bacterium]